MACVHTAKLSTPQTNNSASNTPKGAAPGGFHYLDHTRALLVAAGGSGAVPTTKLCFVLGSCPDWDSLGALPRVVFEAKSLEITKRIHGAITSGIWLSFTLG